MSHAVQIEQAHRLREAETRWLRQSADRLRAAQGRGPGPVEPVDPQTTDPETVEQETER